MLLGKAIKKQFLSEKTNGFFNSELERKKITKTGSEKKIRLSNEKNRLSFLVEVKI